MIEIPARQGKAVRVRKGQTVKVINTRGQQVVDTWAFNADDMREFMSMEHSRVAIGRIIPGDRRHARHQPAKADPDLDRGHLGRDPRHPVRRLRPLALRDARLHRVSR